MRTTRRVGQGLALALGVAISTAAGAQNRNVSTVITRLTDAVTYSALAQVKPARPALTTYVGYLVSIRNGGANTLNSVYFTGTSFIDGTRRAPFAPSDGSPCVQGATDTEVLCTFGQLRSGQARDFVVFFETPLAPNPMPSPAEQVRFAGTTFFAEGTTDSPNSPANSSSPSNHEFVSLGTSNPTRVKTGVRRPGGSLFTGDGAPTAESVAATFASQMRVPALPGSNNYGLAELCESRPGVPNPDCRALPAAADSCPHNVSCLDFVDVTVRDKEIGGNKLRFEPSNVTSPLEQYLVIALRRDSSVFKGNINNANIYYFAEDGTDWVPVPPCANMTDPLAGVDRCVYSRRVYKNNDPEVRANPALAGDAEIVVIAKDNGRLSW